MAKKSTVVRNELRRRLVTKFAEKRKALKAIVGDTSKTPEEREAARRYPQEARQEEVGRRP